MSQYPLRIFNERALPHDYTGRVFVWDIDKTYLNTRFSSFKGLAKIPLEFAVDKRAITGMPEVLKGLRRGPGPGWDLHPLYFVSASPHQLRSIIARRMLLDGVQPDGFIFKDWGRVLLGRRPGRLKEQLGFKLCALLTGRQMRPLCQEYLFGDDTERDAEAFALYAALLRAETEARQRSLLRGAPLRGDDRRLAAKLRARLGPEPGGVLGCYIHLAAGSKPVDFEPYGELIKPVIDAQELAKSLYDSGLIDEQALEQVARACR